MFFLAIQPHAEKSYYEFQHSYTPHNKLQEPNNKVVLALSKETPSSIAKSLSEIIRKKDYSKFQLIICSVKRNQVDAILSRMDRKLLLEGLNILDQEWMQEILYYLKENTYNELLFLAR